MSALFFSIAPSNQFGVLLDKEGGRGWNGKGTEINFIKIRPKFLVLFLSISPFKILLTKYSEQAGAELGQAQPGLGLKANQYSFVGI